MAADTRILVYTLYFSYKIALFIKVVMTKYSLIMHTKKVH